MPSDWDTDLLTIESPSRFSVRGTDGPIVSVELLLPDGFRLVDDSRWSDGHFTLGLAPHQVEEDVVTICLAVANDGEHGPAPKPLLRFTGKSPIALVDGFFAYTAYLDQASGRYLLLSASGGAWGGDVEDGRVTVGPTDQLELPPDNVVRYHWVAHWLESPALLAAVAQPGWYPENPVVESGESIYLDFLDGVIDLGDVKLIDDYPLVRLSATEGQHKIVLSESIGQTSLTLGWAPKLRDLVHRAFNRPLPADLRAWFLAWQSRGLNPHASVLDDLDVAIAEALTEPTPFAVAAAADSVPLLGAPLLDDAFQGLLQLSSPRGFDDGAYLAALRLYCQALAQGSAIAQEVSALMGAAATPSSLEYRALSADSEARSVIISLGWRLGMGLPWQIPTDAQTVALLRAALDAHPHLAASESFDGMEQLATLAARWIRTSCGPRELAWLLW